MLHDLKRYVPTVYNGIQEMDNIISAEQEEIDTLYTEMKLAYNRQSVINCDELGINLYEKLLNIHADSNSENLEFRKERVITQLTTLPPFSFDFLLQQLDKIAGVGNYKAWVDFNNYTLYIQSYISNKLWHSELEYLLAKIKPANILYIYIGYDTNDIGVKSTGEYYNINIGSTQKQWNYSLGFWELGEKAFADITEDDDYLGQWNYKLNGEWKLGREKFFYRAKGIDLGVNNVTDYAKNVLSEYLKTIIKSVVINDEETYSFDSFTYFEVTDNKLEIEFDYILKDTQQKEITNIKIKDENDTLVYKDLYILATQDIKIHLDINIVEVLT